MYFGENNGNFSETKKCFLLSTLSQNEKIFAWYGKRFSHNEEFLSRWDENRLTVLLLWQGKKYSRWATMCPFCIFFFLIRIRDLQCRCNRRYFKRKVLQWARSRVTSALLLVQKVVLLLQILQTWIFSVSFQISSFKTIPLTPLEILKTYPFSKQNNFLKNSFFPSAVIEWNNLHHNIWNVGSFSAFKNNVLKFIRPTPNNVFNCENNRGIKLITRLRVGFSHLRKHKFKHSFQDTLKPTWSCGFDVESTFNYILHCPVYNDERHTLLSLIKNIDCRLLDVNETVLIKTFLFGNCSVDAHTNTQILNATIECILTIKRFDGSLFHF